MYNSNTYILDSDGNIIGPENPLPFQESTPTTSYLIYEPAEVDLSAGEINLTSSFSSNWTLNSIFVNFSDAESKDIDISVYDSANDKSFGVYVDNSWSGTYVAVTDKIKLQSGYEIKIVSDNTSTGSADIRVIGTEGY